MKTLRDLLPHPLPLTTECPACGQPIAFFRGRDGCSPPQPKITLHFDGPPNSSAICPLSKLPVSTPLADLNNLFPEQEI